MINGPIFHLISGSPPQPSLLSSRPVEEFSRPREIFKQNRNQLSRYEEIEQPLNSRPDFTPLKINERLPTRPQSSPDLSNNAFPTLAPFSDEDFAFTRAPIVRPSEEFKRPKRRPEPQSFNDNPFSRPQGVPDFQSFEQAPQKLPQFEGTPFGRPQKTQPFQQFEENTFGRPQRAQQIKETPFGRPQKTQPFQQFEENPFGRPLRTQQIEDTPFGRPQKTQQFEETPFSRPQKKPQFQQFEKTPFSRQPQNKPVNFNAIPDERPLSRPSQKKIPEFDGYVKPKRKTPGYDFVENFDSEPDFRPKRLSQRPQEEVNFNNNPRLKRKQRPNANERRFPYAPHDKPTHYVDHRARPISSPPVQKRPIFQQLPRSRADNFIENPKFNIRSTTPRPIPTPGPMDFPRPPPRMLRPRAPPTHPTHPPMITHPPEHYESVTKKLPLNIPSISFNEVSDAKLSDYDYNDADYNYAEDTGDEGFFNYPGTFPSLEQLGAGFESQKISRNKRSLEEPLSGSQARGPLFRIRRRRNNRNGRRNRRNRNENQSRQGFGFQNNFWDDSNVDADDFFTTFGNRNRDSGYARDTSGYTRGGDSYNRDSYNRDDDVKQYGYSDYYGNGGRSRDAYTEQTIQSYPPASNQNYYDPYQGYGEVINNEVLGSGNFDVIKGGTYYDEDTYYYSTYNRRPQYGEQLFENFRDFADIKNDRYRYPKY